MERNKSSVPAEEHPLRTEGEAALEEKMETVRRGQPVRQPSKEREMPGYEPSREEPDDENRPNKSGTVY